MMSHFAEISISSKVALFPGRGERMNSVIKYGGAAGGPGGDGGVASVGAAATTSDSAMRSGRINIFLN